MITTVTNLDLLISPLRLHYGDINGTEYSEAVYRTSLVSAVKMLSKRWQGKYYIDADNNIQRSTTVTFDTTSPPIIEPQDEYALVLAATVILRQAKLTSSASAFEQWSTPDLSVSSGGKERTYTKLYEKALEELDEYFAKRLGKSRKRFNYTTNLIYPTVPTYSDHNPDT